MKKQFFFGAGIGVLIACLVIAGVLNAGRFLSRQTRTSLKPLQVVDSSGALGLQNAFVQVARMVKPSVVQITTEKVITQRYWDPFGDLDEFFDNFFWGTPRRRQPPRTFQRKQQGLGSGFIIDEQGHILTNNHVIDGVDKILVKLLDEDKKYEAKIVGTDPKTDLALIKVDFRRKINPVIIGNSDSIEVGEWVIAIGNPMGLEETVTVGVVSAKGRSGFGITQYEDFIQTDAAINPGNSGGPLVNIRGEVIGINTFIVSPYAAQNIGFAIPINIARRVFTQLKEHGKVSRGFLGVMLQPLTEDLAESFGLKDTSGALVAEVLKDTPAEKGGIQAGDVILELNGKPIKDIKDLQLKVADTRVGEPVTLTIWREKKKIQLTIRTGEAPEEPIASRSSVMEKTWRGTKVSEITPELKQKFQLSVDKGVVVIEVIPDSPAEEADLTPGTVIRRIGNFNISSLADYQKATSSVKKSESVILWVTQSDRNRFISLKGEK
ncbi:MAG: DegQ family serine endoprotease [Candidatus Omnitrophica bacterium]|nr:DegQ family serine endoprotease [Candidatus Omnitrophota bacterium]